MQVYNPVILGRQDGTAEYRLPEKPRESMTFADDSSTLIWADPKGSQSSSKRERISSAALGSTLTPPFADGSCDRSRDGTSGSMSASTEESSSTNAFQQAMRLGLAPTSYRPADFAFDIPHVLDSEPSADSWSANVEKMGFAARRYLESQMSAGEGLVRAHISKFHNVFVSKEDRGKWGILHAASYFGFSYPVLNAEAWQITSQDAKVADIALLVFGGYMFFDSDLRLIDVRALVPGEGAGALRLKDAQPWSVESTTALGAHRWHPVTLPAPRHKGARYFCWLLPGEALPGQSDALVDDGGFAFIFHEPTETGVLQAQFDTLLAIAGNRGNPCPKCSRPMQWSAFDQGSYARGWDCEHFRVCGVSSMKAGRYRWFCAECSFDMCNRCHNAM